MTDYNLNYYAQIRGKITKISSTIRKLFRFPRKITYIADKHKRSDLLKILGINYSKKNRLELIPILSNKKT
jgi:hypothetical protein